MIKKRIKKVKRVSGNLSERVSDVAKEKAVALNPLTPKVEAPPSLENVPKITTENITEHREEVLSGARKYIYPLQHSKKKIVSITLGIVGVAVVFFAVYCVLGLYRYYQYNTFLYRVTQVVPFPIAKTGKQYVDYEDYLFELRHFVHYTQTQQQQAISSDATQLELFRKQALDDVVNASYIKILARQNNVSVSNKEVDARIAEVRNQNRLGSNSKVFDAVLRDYWGWTEADFKRSLKQQILAEKVVAKLDTATTARAQAALAQINSGADFGSVAKAVSDDPSKANGGDYGIAIAADNPNIPPQVITALFSMQVGQVSGVVNTGSTLEILKLTGKSGATVTAQHMSFNLQPVSTYVDALKKTQPTKLYVHFN